jgi:hypothetical protein
MFPPVYRTLRANPAVVAIVDSRLGAHGEVPQNTARPYITWQIVIGLPHDQISGPPPSDFTTVQIDCWHQDDKGVEQLASAVRDALDSAGVANRLVIDHRDRGTRLYRVGLEADFITQR